MNIKQLGRSALHTVLACAASLVALSDNLFRRGAASNVNTTWDEVVGQYELAGPPMLVDSGIPAGERQYRWLLYKIGSAPGILALNGANDEPFAVVDNDNVVAAASTSPPAEYVTPLLLYGRGQTLKAVAAGAIVAGAKVYTAANGQVSALSASAGTYYLVGKAITPASVIGDIIAFMPTLPTAVVVS